jgi:hypothetical protein
MKALDCGERHANSSRPWTVQVELYRLLINAGAARRVGNLLIGIGNVPIEENGGWLYISIPNSSNQLRKR